MGCECGKQKKEHLEQIAHNEEDIAAVSVSGADRYLKFESTLPFARTMIFGFEKNVREAAERNEGENKDFVTIENLRLELVTEAWSALDKDKSTLRRMLRDPYLQYEWEDDYQGEKIEGALDVMKLQMLGLPGARVKKKKKLKLFWAILQDGDQDFIAASDKDYPPAIEALCHLATIFEFKNSRDHAAVECGYNDEDFQAMEDAFETVLEAHLDELFDYSSKLEKHEWLKIVGEKTPYVFSAALLREKVLAEA
eukprot:CAMPEP_0176377028 /NCGR_PEP_ID=MMETSP0126-20121128/28597_1 /TAXON_ID=141414 ORGANISM="Strombidinopsis acuminatum, Strain SPMC142" /NCGR_SAMPLE_ID=MMETSP0126 /ASSEMBLY_ACC=CAM_ASM_000229 /LENGTH=252 /DNA_ID=CAMNT_0017738693 /DNA_START=25 /DNA_END=783 /DNA_ORIENTATION=-